MQPRRPAQRRALTTLARGAEKHNVAAGVLERQTSFSPLPRAARLLLGGAGSSAKT